MVETPRQMLDRTTSQIAFLEEQRALAIARLRSEYGLGWREIGELTGLSHEGARRRWG